MNKVGGGGRSRKEGEWMNKVGGGKEQERGRMDE